MIRAYTYEYIFLLMLIGVLEFTVSFLTGHNFQRVFVGLYIELLLIWNVQKWKYFESSKNLRTRLEVRLSRANYNE